MNIDTFLRQESDFLSLVKVLSMIDGGKWKRISVNLNALYGSPECLVYLKSMIENDREEPRHGFPQDVFSILLSLFMKATAWDLIEKQDKSTNSCN